MTDSESEAPDGADAAGSTPRPLTAPAGDTEPESLRVRNLTVGTILFDRFKLIPAPGREDSLVGQGGMGIIHLAKDALLDRVVAIKLPPQNVVLDEAAKLDLLVETRQALALTHPNIVRVYDFHESARDELWGISMQYVRGINLAEMRSRLAQGSHARKPFTAERIRPWIRQICEALVHAHEFAGFVHRDLNPKNIMLEVRATPGEEQAREHILITDFGIAATIRHSLGKSGHESRRSWHGAGTLPYMPWDQIMGKRPSASDDIYALGATIFDLLTATTPFFEGPPDSILTQIERAIPPTMTERRRDLDLATPDRIPPEWEDLVRDCLRKDPAQRPHSVREVARRLGFDLPSRSSSPPPGDEGLQGPPSTGAPSHSGGHSSATGPFGQESDTVRRSGRVYQSHRTQRTESKRLAVVMFTDIVGSVALQQRLGTAAYTELVARHDLMVEAALRDADDAEVLNETGDGFVVRFSEPSDAVQTALRLQFMAAKTLVEGAPIGIRVGIHLGVITEMEERVRGETRRVGMVLNLAARVMDMARPGQILVTRAIFDDARQFVRTHPAVEGWKELPPVVWMVHGDFLFKGSDDPLALFEVGAESIAPLLAPEDGAKGRKLSGSGSDQLIKSLPRPPSGSDAGKSSPADETPSPDQLRAERERYESAHRELQSEIERLRESEAERARELNAEAEILAQERARLESLSARLAEQREAEEQTNRELREEAGNALREAERKSAELIASLAAEKAAFEKDMEARAVATEAAAQQKIRALEEQERGILEDEKRMSEDRDARNDRSLQLVRERERLKAERHAFGLAMEAEKQRIEEERLAFLRTQDEERARVEGEIERERAQKEAALAELRSTLADQESELRRQSEELARAEDRIRAMQAEEHDPDHLNASLVEQLDQEARRFEARIGELNADLERNRRLQKRRLTVIAVGSIVLALGVGMVSAKLVWGFWPWKLFTSEAETRPKAIVKGLKQLETEGDWLRLLSSSIQASPEIWDSGDEEDARTVASLKRQALHQLADPSGRAWESDPSRLLECLEQLRNDGTTLPPAHGFLMVKIRIAQARQSPRLAGFPEAVDAYLASQSEPAGPELSAELDQDLNALQGDLLDRLDTTETVDPLPDEAAIQRALESFPEEARPRVPLIALADGLLRIRVRLRQRPPGFPSVLQELERLETADESWKPRLRKPFAQILASLAENPEALPSTDALISLSTRWKDPRPLVVALDNLEMTHPAFNAIAEHLWRQFHINRPPSAPPLPADSRAWIAWLAVNGSDRGHSEKGLATLRELAADGHAKAGYFLVAHQLIAPPETGEDLVAWKSLAEKALAAGETGALVQLGEIHWRIGKSLADPEAAAASRKEACDYFRRAARDCRQTSDRDTAVIMLAGVFAENGAKGIEERREMAEFSLRAGVVLWRTGEIALAEKNWEKALEADRELAEQLILKATAEAESPEVDALRNAWQTWKDTKAPPSPPSGN